MSGPKTAMVLAAGFGTRMGALTANKPKPLLEAGGRALIDHALARCTEGGVSRAVVNLHYLGEQIRQHLTGHVSPEIVFSEETEILETGGGLVQAAPLLGDDPIFTMNSDAIWTGPPPLPRLVEAWDPARMDALLLLVRREDAMGYARAGDFSLNDGKLMRRGEASTAPYVYTGAQILSPAALAHGPAGAFSLNVIWDALLARGRLFGVVHDGGWVDVGSPEGLARAEEALR
ncbi:MAG: nucleotidyltransferase family protein [Pikeienuella sp.]